MKEEQMLRLTALLAVLIMAAAGCGSDGTEPQPTHAPTAKETTTPVAKAKSTSRVSGKSILMSKTRLYGFRSRRHGFSVKFPTGAAYLALLQGQIRDFEAGAISGIEGNLDVNRKGTRFCTARNSSCVYDTHLYWLEVRTGTPRLKQSFCPQPNAIAIKLGGRPAKLYRCPNIIEVLVSRGRRSFRLTASTGPKGSPSERLAKRFIRSLRFTE